MQQETIFLHGLEPKKVLLNQERVRELKQALKFEPRSEYYLRLPNETYAPILIFCLTAQNNSLSKKNKTTLKNLEEAFRKQIQRLYLSENQARKQFIGPYQLEILSHSANYHQKLFRKCHTDFKESDIIYNLDLFKNKFKVVISSYKNNKHLASDKKLENSQEVFYLIKDNNSIILCAYSSRPKPASKEERLLRASAEFIPKDQKQLRKQIESRDQEAKQIINKQPSKKNQQGQNGQQEQESKLHYTYTAMLVSILIALLYFSFAEIDPNFFKGTNQRYQKSILQHLIEGVDSVTDLIFGPK